MTPNFSLTPPSSFAAPRRGLEKQQKRKRTRLKTHHQSDAGFCCEKKKKKQQRYNCTCNDTDEKVTATSQ